MPFAVEVLVSRLAAFVISSALLVAVVCVQLSQAARVRAYDTLASRLYHVAVIGDSYTAGTDEGGLGPNAWTARTWQTLAAKGVRVAADVAAEGRAGYGVPGDHGSVFEDLTARAVKSDDVLVVFFGSRNDQGVDPVLLTERARATFDLARQFAPSARFLVIGPPWPTADPPDTVLRIRDALKYQAGVAGATFIDPIVAGWFVGRPELIGKDGIHPTDAGHAYMAEKIEPLIDAQLTRRI